jgi:catechol O-methyltransferase
VAGKFHMVFLDHVKSLYLLDAQLLCKLGGIAQGSIVFADNVIFPGCPDYLAWVRSNSFFSRSVFIEGELEYTSKDGKWQVRSTSTMLLNAL